MPGLRSLPAALVSLGVLAVLGAAFGEIHQRTLLGKVGPLGDWLTMFVGYQANPFAGRIFGGSASHVLGWLLGLVAAGAVLWLVRSAVARRTDDATATFLGTWVGTVLGVGVGAVLSALVLFGSSGFGGRIYATQLLQSVQHGFYWGVFAGPLVAFGVLMFAGPQRPRTAVGDSLNPPQP